MFILRSPCQILFSPPICIFCTENLILSQQKKSWQGVKSAFFIFPKTKSCQNTPRIRSKKWKLNQNKFKHIKFSVWCYADNDPLNIFESLTAGTITYISWKFSIDIRHRTRKKCILFIKSEIVEFMVNSRQVPPTCQTRTCWASPMDWMLSGNS